MINPEDYVRDTTYNPLKGMRQGYVIDLDKHPVDVVKNGKQYSLTEFIEECISDFFVIRIEHLKKLYRLENDVLDLRMKEERE